MWNPEGRGLLEGLRAQIIREIQPAEADPHFREIERDDVLDHRVVPV